MSDNMKIDQKAPIVATAAVAIRVPIEVPVRTSFGIMSDRPAVFLRVTDREGRQGYGEVWCNFPVVAAEHRMRLAREVVGPVLLATDPSAEGIYEQIMSKLHILAIQSGEWGPLRQVAAGFDAAVFDLRAKQAGLPLYRFLNRKANGKLKAYASGIGPEQPGIVAQLAAEAGHVAFKLKVGFGTKTDLRSLDTIRAAIGDSRLMVDANQGWNVVQACENIGRYAPYDLTWVEEPLPADRPLEEWQQVADQSTVSLAAGENCNRIEVFKTMMASGNLGYVQPDVAKWGGVSGCIEVAQSAQDSGLIYCPHFLGSSVGLMTSAHLLAAQGGKGMLEIDVNPNSLRDEILADKLRVENGQIALAESPGIGVDIRQYFND